MALKGNGEKALSRHHFSLKSKNNTVDPDEDIGSFEIRSH